MPRKNTADCDLPQVYLVQIQLVLRNTTCEVEPRERTGTWEIQILMALWKSEPGTHKNDDRGVHLKKVSIGGIQKYHKSNNQVDLNLVNLW